MFQFLAALLTAILGRGAIVVTQKAIAPSAAEAAMNVPKPVQNTSTYYRQLSADKNIDAVARTIYGEARSEVRGGMEAVANVIKNRVKIANQISSYARRFGGKTFYEICHAPKQFSCWNYGDPNRAKILAVQTSDPVFQTCLLIAHKAVNFILEDNTGGSVFYHTVSVSPTWSRGITPINRIGSHVFYTREQIA